MSINSLKKKNKKNPEHHRGLILCCLNHFHQFKYLLVLISNVLARCYWSFKVYSAYS